MIAGPDDRQGAGRACDERIDRLVELSVRGGASDPELERHVAGCAGCAEYFDWLSPAADLLGEAVPGRAPSKDLKRRVMSEVRTDRAAAPSPGLSGLFAQRRLVLAGAAAATLAIGAGTALILDEDGPGTSTHSVLASSADSPITGELVRDGDAGVLHLDGLPRLEGDRVYQAWIRNGERVEPSTVFVANRTRGAEATIPAGLDRADEVLVTAEPSGGSAVPSTDPLLGVELS